LELFHLASDRGESKDVSAQNPEIVQRLQKMAQTMRDQLGDSLTQSTGKEIRPSGKIGKSQ
ncbi:MAG: arylsulfatase, partial [Planctomycetota bacterium]|nr:arylsulfatase [Planctomycetota bacterium]